MTCFSNQSALFQSIVIYLAITFLYEITSLSPLAIIWGKNVIVDFFISHFDLVRKLNVERPKALGSWCIFHRRASLEAPSRLLDDSKRRPHRIESKSAFRVDWRCRKKIKITLIFAERTRLRPTYLIERSFDKINLAGEKNWRNSFLNCSFLCFRLCL